MNTESTMNMQTSLPQTDKMTVSASAALPQTGDRLSMENETIKIQVNDLKLYYGNDQALKGIDMVIPERKVTAFIGPSGCGKSTLLRCFNREECRVVCLIIKVRPIRCERAHHLLDLNIGIKRSTKHIACGAFGERRPGCHTDRDRNREHHGSGDGPADTKPEPTSRLIRSAK